MNDNTDCSNRGEKSNALYAIIVAVLSGLALLALSGGLAYYLDKVYLPRTMRKNILESLETTERIGISDLNTNTSAVAKRWSLIGVGVSDNKEYGLESYVPRLEAALRLMTPVEARLRQQINKDGIPLRLRG